MSKIQKACPVVFRATKKQIEVLAFNHPSAGKQFVKGTIESGETPRAAAERELREESGISVRSPLIFLGTHEVGTEYTPWHFFSCQSAALPDAWQHIAEDDQGYTLTFFWHPIHQPLDQHWHEIFHEAFAFFAPHLMCQ